MKSKLLVALLIFSTKIIIILVIGNILGCIVREENTETLNREKLNSPIYIGELPDGRKMYRYDILWLDGLPEDRVYVVNNSDSVTTINSGKHNKVVAEIE